MLYGLGSESLLKRAIVLARGEESPKRRQTARCMKAVSMDEVIEETAAYFDLAEQDYVKIAMHGGCARDCHVFASKVDREPLSRIFERFGLSHPDSSSNLLRRAKKRMDESRDYFLQAIVEIEYNLILNSTNKA